MRWRSRRSRRSRPDRTRRPARLRPLQLARPRLLHQVVPEAVVRGRLHELEPRALVESARVVEDVVRPQGDPAIADALGEAQALLDQPRADPAATAAGLDEQQAQLGDVLLAAHAEHAADRRAVDLGDPRSLAARVAALDVLGDDPRDEGLERLVPAVLLRVEDAVAGHDTTVVPDVGRAQGETVRVWNG